MALEYYGNALSLAQKQNLNDKPLISVILTNLGNVYMDLGEWDRAEIHFKDARKMSREAHRDLHLDVALAYNRIALLYSRSERTAEAEIAINRSIKITVPLLGEENVNIGGYYNIPE